MSSSVKEKEQKKERKKEGIEEGKEEEEMVCTVYFGEG